MHRKAQVSEREGKAVPTPRVNTLHTRNPCARRRHGNGSWDASIGLRSVSGVYFPNASMMSCEGKRDRPKTKIDAPWFQLSSPMILLRLGSQKNIKLKRQIRVCPEVPAVTQMPVLGTMGLPPTEHAPDRHADSSPLSPKPWAAL